MKQTRHELVLPDLGLAGVPIYAGEWLVDAGKRVACGDRLLELLAGSVLVDLPSPADGVLTEQRVSSDDELHLGQVLGIVLGPAGREQASDSDASDSAH